MVAPASDAFASFGSLFAQHSHHVVADLYEDDCQDATNGDVNKLSEDLFH